MVAIVLEVVLLLTANLTFGEILWISLFVTLIAYLIGDLIILRASNNTVATLADFGLSLVTIYLFNVFWYRDNIPFLSALISAAVLGVGEWFFHKYLAEDTRE
jgi:hypothetical protein